MWDKFQVFFSLSTPQSVKRDCSENKLTQKVENPEKRRDAKKNSELSRRMYSVYCEQPSNRRLRSS